jgi:hypothetical protein
MENKMQPTQYELDTYEGRKLSEREELQEGYCGSCPIETHIAQLNDPNSWVHSCKEGWYAKYHGQCLKYNRHNSKQPDLQFLINRLITVCESTISELKTSDGGFYFSSLRNQLNEVVQDTKVKLKG